jgi:hypothetical protein
MVAQQLGSSQEIVEFLVANGADVTAEDQVHSLRALVALIRDNVPWNVYKCLPLCATCPFFPSDGDIYHRISRK